MDESLVVIGVDAHKCSHTLVATDAVGRRLAEIVVDATSDGHVAGLAWAGRWPARRWAVEDCRPLTRRLESDLLGAGEQLVRVPPKLMAGLRRGVREVGKSDPIDALAVARAAWREPDLPSARLAGVERELRLLVDHRDNLVRERARLQTRVRWHLHELDPGLQVRLRGLGSQRAVERVIARLQEQEGTLVEITRELLERIGELNRRTLELEHEITRRVTPLASTLLELPGCGPLTAAKIIAETAGVTRFHSKAAYARWNGTAPQPVWSGNTRRYRLARSGNRQVNAALHRIALTQTRLPTLGRAYFERRIATGNTRTEALRLLRRRLSDVVYRTLINDETTALSTST